MSKRTVLIITTGGTIQSRYNPGLKRVTPGVSVFDLLECLDIEGFEIHVREFMNVPGPHLSPEAALPLSELLELSAASYDGIVVLQGTDTLEEFAYLVSLITRVTKPVVFTGAMKGLGDYYSDAPGNIHCAVSVAGSEQSQGRGLLVVFNEKIYLPREVCKSDTSNMDSFRSALGPVGEVAYGQVYYFRPAGEQAFYEKKIETGVDLFKAVIGGSSRYLDQAIESGVRGIVLEAFGAGNIPPAWAVAVERAIARKIPVVISSRSATGSVSPVYDYLGGGKNLKEMGAIFTRQLSAAKARIKLMVLLGQQPQYTFEELKTKFL